MTCIVNDPAYDAFPWKPHRPRFRWLSVFTSFAPRDIGHPYAGNLLRNLLALAWTAPEGAAAAATATINAPVP